MIFVPSTKIPVTSLSLIFNGCGSALDAPHKRGLATIAMRMLLEGGGGLNTEDFNARLNRYGISLSTRVSNDYSLISLNVISECLEQGLELLAKALYQPLLGSDQFYKLKKRYQANFVENRQENRSLKAYEAFIKQIYQNRAEGFLPAGTLDGIAALELDDVIDYHQRLIAGFAPDATTEQAASKPPVIIACCSNLGENEVLNLTAKHLGNLIDDNLSQQNIATPDAIELNQASQPDVFIVADKDGQTDEIMCGAFSVSRTTANWPWHSLIAYILGGDMNSRLFQLIRNQNGFSYGASAWYEAARGNFAPNRPAPFMLHTFPSIEHTEPCLKLLLHTYHDFVASGPTLAELELSQRARINALPFKASTPQRLLMLKLIEHLYGIKHNPQDEQQSLAAAQPESIAKLLLETHQPEKLLTVIVGDPERLSPIIHRTMPSTTMHVLEDNCILKQ